MDCRGEICARNRTVVIVSLIAYRWIARMKIIWTENTPLIVPYKIPSHCAERIHNGASIVLVEAYLNQAEQND
jgi:hypothetical protein